MLIVVALKVVSWPGNEAAQLAAQQHRGQDVTIIIGGFVGTCIADRQREGSLRCRQLQTYGDRVVRFVCSVRAQLIDALNRFNASYFRDIVDILHRSKEQTVGQYLPIAVEDCHVVDACR